MTFEKKRAPMPPGKPAPPRPAARAARIVKFQAYYPVPRTGTVLPGGAWAHLVTAPAPRFSAVCRGSVKMRPAKPGGKNMSEQTETVAGGPTIWLANKRQRRRK